MDTTVQTLIVVALVVAAVAFLVGYFITRATQRKRRQQQCEDCTLHKLVTRSDLQEKNRQK